MAGRELSPQEKLSLIKDQLQEVLHEDILENVILKEQRPLVIYWGTATTGRPHCGYFVPMMKIAHFLRAGCRVKILLADIHGFLDNLKAPIELVKFRAEYYKYIIQSLLKAVGVSLEKLEFVLGSSYQLSSDYTMDIFRLSSVVTEHDAKKAGAEVVKQVDNATLSGLIYPLMQALDEQHLGVDAQFGGVDQRKIFALAQETLPKIGYKERAHLMNPMVPGLAGGKMSASDPDSKIDILDTADAVKKKLRKAYAASGEIEGNGIISFVEYVLLPISSLKDPESKGRFVCERREGEGDPLVYYDIETLKEDYRADKLTPQLLKAGASAALIDLLAPIQADFQASQEWQEIERKAYPPAEPAKKKKQPKDKGSRYPGAGNVKTNPDGSVEGKGKEEIEVGKTAGDAMSKLEINGDDAAQA
ncbi:Tyrosine--tRNA ligase cytoplasmic [Elasticomyces elasticus]|uniref:Tyrosine--tRNA ligase n=1 Tax=Exophiala sideris TaxID=1016849 RepID=A0ABR0J3F8_9EURO|nr:Tyrosine--tRNA ligase cytoplasmic [Elasticomyces elasticus]KAK5026472.1 Tyrosine--tRNA ligase cytoplasmic [Exophiala sideris]KAK5033786.1 Tyrosine--tRNA ligase cytoplasmic [Exophiala sideris]KAK5055608.1 Tyrosine--tRNA ligase cytoplasmic [Exophiala sideris]KAK5180007.1 Tyrosine--tRNA ligase cytoplasmic [Eurotiomycetes sp. CCFEE 6388]